MDIVIKVCRKTIPIGTPASGGCEYSYNLIAKIKDISEKQAEIVREAILEALRDKQ